MERPRESPREEGPPQFKFLQTDGGGDAGRTRGNGIDIDKAPSTVNEADTRGFSGATSTPGDAAPASTDGGVREASTHVASLHILAASAAGGAERVGRYMLGEEIGRGSFASVYKGTADNGDVAAVKSVLRSKLNKRLSESLESEISILKALQHKNIVALFGIEKTSRHINLLMEFCAGGDLSAYIKEHRTPTRADRDTGASVGGGLTMREVDHFAFQLRDGLQFLRSRDLMHRDLKPQNLLLVPGGAGENAPLPVLKIADFGFARFLPVSDLADTLCGSPLYMAPEILRYEKYDARADLWSVGTILFEMMCGRPPFRAPNHILLLQKIEATDTIRFPARILLEDAAGSVKRNAVDLATRLLRRKQAQRITFAEFFAHPYFVRNATPESSEQPQQSKKSADTSEPAATRKSHASGEKWSDPLLPGAHVPATDEREREREREHSLPLAIPGAQHRDARERTRTEVLESPAATVSPRITDYIMIPDPRVIKWPLSDVLRECDTKIFRVKSRFFWKDLPFAGASADSQQSSEHSERKDPSESSGREEQRGERREERRGPGEHAQRDELAIVQTMDSWLRRGTILLDLAKSSVLDERAKRRPRRPKQDRHGSQKQQRTLEKPAAAKSPYSYSHLRSFSLPIALSLGVVSGLASKASSTKQQQQEQRAGDPALRQQQTGFGPLIPAQELPPRVHAKTKLGVFILALGTLQRGIEAAKLWAGQNGLSESLVFQSFMLDDDDDDDDEHSTARNAADAKEEEELVSPGVRGLTHALQDKFDECLSAAEALRFRMHHPRRGASHGGDDDYDEEEDTDGADNIDDIDGDGGDDDDDEDDGTEGRDRDTGANPVLMLLHGVSTELVKRGEANESSFRAFRDSLRQLQTAQKQQQQQASVPPPRTIQPDGSPLGTSQHESSTAKQAIPRSSSIEALARSITAPASPRPSYMQRKGGAGPSSSSSATGASGSGQMSQSGNPELESIRRIYAVAHSLLAVLVEEGPGLGPKALRAMRVPDILYMQQQQQQATASGAGVMPQLTRRESYNTLHSASASLQSGHSGEGASANARLVNRRGSSNSLLSSSPLNPLSQQQQQRRPSAQPLAAPLSEEEKPIFALLRSIEDRYTALR